jgi:hypothetical protein
MGGVGSPGVGAGVVDGLVVAGSGEEGGGIVGAVSAGGVVSVTCSSALQPPSSATDRAIPANVDQVL